jgi:hypothetical protein
MITGGILWGAAGMILFIPFASIAKTDCRSFASFKNIIYTVGGGGRENINKTNYFVHVSFSLMVLFFKTIH